VVEELELERPELVTTAPLGYLFEVLLLSAAASAETS